MTVWGGISSDGIIGPIFCDGTGNGINYLHMRQTVAVPQLRQRDDFDELCSCKTGRHHSTPFKSEPLWDRDFQTAGLEGGGVLSGHHAHQT